MSPPIDIDGSEIQKATIDGQNVNQVTIDGQEVFVDVGIPDTSMFQSPIYQFWAGDINANDGDSPVDFPELLAGLSDATAQNTPTYRINPDRIEYDPVDTDHHTWSADAQLPTGDDALSFFATIQLNNNPSDSAVVGYGNSDNSEGIALRIVNSAAEIDIIGVSSITGGTVNEDAIITLGGTYAGGSNGDVTIYTEGAETGSGTASLSLADANHLIGLRPDENDLPIDGDIIEVVVCDAEESATAASDYHDDRTA